MEHRKNPVIRFFSAVWGAVDATRRFAFNAIFLLILILLLAALLQDGKPKVDKSVALVLNPHGDVVEQLAGDPRQRAIQKALGDEDPQTLVSDLLDALATAKNDKRVKAVVLSLDEMGGIGPSKVYDLTAAIRDFKESGKKVFAVGDSYDLNSYLIASAADEIFLHHQGMVLIEGYGRFRTYYKQGLDRLGVDWHIFHVGEYKSATEPFRRDDMSEEAKTANRDFLGDLWESYLEEVSSNRNLTRQALLSYVGDFDQYAHAFAERIQAAAGNGAQAALEAGLVDVVGDRDTYRDRLIELVGEDEEHHSFHQIGFADYLLATAEGPSLGPAGDRVGVLVASGSILDGTQPPGTIGGDSTAALIRKARHDDGVKALVLRVDSGGGSAFASDVIRRELQLAREAGKPVVVSMSSVAASGGYWISTASDEIWASRDTITGSIGIFAMFPTFQKPLQKYLGWTVDGVGTTPLSGALRVDRELTDEVGAVIQTMVEEGYDEFVTKVAESRGKSWDEIDAIARGRVWSGKDALELGLVDKLGSLDEAVESAAQLANLGDDYEVEVIERELELKDRILLELFSTVQAFLPDGLDLSARRGPGSELLRFLDRQLRVVDQLNDPHGLYSHCFCELE